MTLTNDIDFSFTRLLGYIGEVVTYLSEVAYPTEPSNPVNEKSIPLVNVIHTNLKQNHNLLLFVYYLGVYVSPYIFYLLKKCQHLGIKERRNIAEMKWRYVPNMK